MKVKLSEKDKRVNDVGRAQESEHLGSGFGFREQTTEW